MKKKLYNLLAALIVLGELLLFFTTRIGYGIVLSVLLLTVIIILVMRRWINEKS